MEKTPDQIRAQREQAKLVKQDRKLETQLKQSFQQCTTQLKEIETMIANNPNSTELMRLIEVERELKEGVASIEESLLNLKKAQLLEQFSALEEGGENSEDDDGGDAPLYAQDHPVQALYTGKEGAMWMDATILKACKKGGKSVLVSYDTPLEVSMKTCRFVSTNQRNQCRYGDQCKFSHGFLLPVSSVRERVMEKLVQGGPCLAKFEDGLWYEGSIEKYIDEKTISVYYNGYNQTANLDIDEIVPLPQIAHKHDRKKGELRHLQHVEISVTQLVDKEFGDWQAHTKGFGLKMLEKFGFKPGEGLGRDGQGITEPVAKDSQVHLPFATSVDNAAVDLEKMKAIREREDRKAKRKLQEMSEHPPEPEEGSTFQYLNKLSEIEQAPPSDTPQQSTKPKLAKLTPAETRKRLRQLTDEVTQTKNELQANLNGYSRNKNNPDLAATYQKRAQMIQKVLEKKQQEITGLQRSLTPAKKGIF